MAWAQIFLLYLILHQVCLLQKESIKVYNILQASRKLTDICTSNRAWLGFVFAKNNLFFKQIKKRHENIQYSIRLMYEDHSKNPFWFVNFSCAGYTLCFSMSGELSYRNHSSVRFTLSSWEHKYQLVIKIYVVVPFTVNCDKACPHSFSRKKKMRKNRYFWPPYIICIYDRFILIYIKHHL